ncbi:hypothetical protein ACJMK2_024931 [Sinanodonta woodiana]|uniref:Uncharacterized protein n=1 Tax=Sinanodonta woodiana TaxID=1069815 RepID=A0ABD3XIR6_SINWO
MYEPDIVLSDRDENDLSDSDSGDDIRTQADYQNIRCRSPSISEEKIEECSLTCIINQDGFIASCLNIHFLETSFYEYVQVNGRFNENDQIHM